MSEEQPTLRATILKRQEQLRATYINMAKRSRRNGTISLAIKLLVVILGGFVAFRDTTGLLFGPANAAIHLVASIAIAILAAVEATLQLERKSERLNILATNCRNVKYQIESRLVKIDAMTTPERKSAAEMEVLDEIDQHFQEFQNQAAALKVNTVLLFPSPDSQRT
jgi:hypothetical protein